MTWYNRGIFEIIAQTTNLDTGAILILLLSSTASFNRDDDFVSGIVANEISTTGYSRQTLANTTIALDDTNDRVTFDADNVAYTALGPSSGGPIIGFAVVYRNTGADASSPLLINYDLVDTQTNGSDLTIQWNAVGLSTFTSP